MQGQKDTCSSGQAQNLSAEKEQEKTTAESAVFASKRQSLHVYRMKDITRQRAGELDTPSARILLQMLPS